MERQYQGSKEQQLYSELEIEVKPTMRPISIRLDDNLARASKQLQQQEESKEKSLPIFRKLSHYIVNKLCGSDED